MSGTLCYQEVHMCFMSACVELKYILLFRSNLMLPLKFDGFLLLTVA